MWQDIPGPVTQQGLIPLDDEAQCRFMGPLQCFIYKYASRARWKPIGRHLQQAANLQILQLVPREQHVQPC